MVAVLGHLAQSGVQRRHQPLAVEHAEQRGQPHPHARIDAQPLAITLEQVVDHLADRLAELRPLHRLRQHREPAVDHALVPALPAGDAERGGEQGRHRLPGQRAART